MRGSPVPSGNIQDPFQTQSGPDLPTLVTPSSLLPFEHPAIPMPHLSPPIFAGSLFSAWTALLTPSATPQLVQRPHLIKNHNNNYHFSCAKNHVTCFPGIICPNTSKCPMSWGIIILILQARGLWLREVQGPEESCTARGWSWAWAQGGQMLTPFRKLRPLQAGLRASAQLIVSPPSLSVSSHHTDGNDNGNHRVSTFLVSSVVGGAGGLH